MFNEMYESSQTWRKKLRLKFLVDVARKQLESGKEFDEFSTKLEKEMKDRWRLVKSTRKEYLSLIRKVLDNQFVLRC